MPFHRLKSAVATWSSPPPSLRKKTCCWIYRTQKSRKKSPSVHHRTILSGHIFATKACIDNRKKALNSNISSTCPHNIVNFGLLATEIWWRVWGTPANFNRFRVLASLLHRRRSTEVNKTLHDVWPSPGLVHYIYILEDSCPLTQFRQLQNSLCFQVLPCPILAALLYGTRAAAVSQTLWRCTRNGITELLQRAPSRRASTHILVHHKTMIDSVQVQESK